MKQWHSMLRALPAVAFSALLAACASVGNPGGGPRDEDPPRFVRSNPAPGSLNVTRDRIVLTFDEIVNVKDAFTNVVVSPVSKSVPRVSSNGRRVTVDFTDTLRPNTTYTIDFGNSIEDNNEQNKLQGFTYTFSTGAELDTMRISGMVLGARDLEPQQGILVGIQSNLADSAFSRLPLERVARTDDRGRFTIRGVRPGTYKIFSLKDVDNDYSHANPEEEMAFLDYVVVPGVEPITVTDTIWNLKTAQVDTVVERQTTRYLPNDILLRSFVPDAAQLYLVNSERKDSTRLEMIFSAPSPELPKLSVAGAPDMKDWYVLERSAHNDTLVYWLKNRSLIMTDTLRLSSRYMRTDSLRRISEYSDTLKFMRPKQKAAKKLSKKDLDPEKLAADSLARLKLDFRLVSSTPQEVYMPMMFEFSEPLERLDTTAFHLEVKVDTLWRPTRVIPKIERTDTLNPRLYSLRYPWSYDTEYRLRVDTLAATGIYGRVSAPLSQEFRSRKEEDYCSLSLTLTGWNDTVPGFVELLNQSDKPVRREQLDHGHVLFRFLPPGKYYARVIEDLNGDGIYTTGDYDSLRLPETAFYYPKAFNLTKNWDKSETWDVWATAVDLQKPKAVKQNKPESDKRRRGNDQDELEEEEDETFDPTRNPFDPNDTRKRRRVTGSGAIGM